MTRLPATQNLFLSSDGASLDYGSRALYISDLNPTQELGRQAMVETQWRMSRWELFMLGVRCIGIALEPPRDLPQHRDLPRFIIAMLVIALIAGSIGLAFAVYGTGRGLD